MKRPGVVLAYFILVCVGILMNIIGALIALTNPRVLGIGTPFAMVSAVISLITVIPAIIFIVLFFNLKKNCLTWLYISFGIYFVLGLIGMNWLAVILSAVVGWVVWDYIVHKKIDGKPVFT